MARIALDGFGQLELNNVAFRRDGRIEAQCKPNADDFATTKIENGMILVVDNVAREVKLPESTLDADALYAIVYSAEVFYDERHHGKLEDFYYGVDGGDFLPRLGYLSRGDKFTTNTVDLGTTGYSDVAAVKAAVTASSSATVVYGGADATGAIKLSTTKPSAGPVLQVIDRWWKMPDGQAALTFQVL